MTTEILIGSCPHSELIDMYKKRIRHEYTQEQLTDGVVDWTYAHILNCYEHKSEPPMPDTLSSYYNFNSNERKNLHPEIAEKIEKQKKYYEYAKSKWKSECIASKSFLIVMAQSFLRRNKIAELDKVEDIINRHDNYGTADVKEYEGTKVEIAKKIFKGEVRSYKD